MSQLYLINPQTFDPAEFLPVSLLKRSEDARYFVNAIYRRAFPENKYVAQLKGEFLMNIMRKDAYADVIHSLIDGGAVDRIGSYVVGAKSFGYSLAPRFANERHVRVPVTDKRLERRLLAFHEKQNESEKQTWKPIHFQLESLQKHLQIHGNCARETLYDLPGNVNQNDNQGIMIADIEQRHFRFSVGRYGRVSNNITSMSRSIRPYLHISGHPLCSVDVVGAQPAFLGQLLFENFSKEFSSHYGNVRIPQQGGEEQGGRGRG